MGYALVKVTKSGTFTVKLNGRSPQDVRQKAKRRGISVAGHQIWRHRGFGVYYPSNAKV